MKNIFKNNTGGFTLIELLVVVLIIVELWVSQEIREMWLLDARMWRYSLKSVRISG